MKIRVYQNKKNGVVSVEYRNIRFFCLQNLKDILKINGLTIYSEYYVFANDDLLKTFDEVRTISKNTIFTNLETSNLILTKLAKKLEIGYVLLIDGNFGEIKEENIVDDLIDKKFRFFISIDYAENEVLILINSNCYDGKLINNVKNQFCARNT